MGRTVTGGKDPATIGWLTQDADTTKFLFGDRYAAEPLGELRTTIFSAVPHFPAWQCASCHFVEFSYAEFVSPGGPTVPSRWFCGPPVRPARMAR
jgi:hypothetical protein